MPFKANINWHSSGQLLLTPVSYTTDYYPPDSTLFDAITGTDGDEAVFPYRSQHSSDLYESNGDTIDNAYHNYGIIGWTPEMDTCATMGEPSGCNSFASPDNESKVNAVFEKNLSFALNVTHSLPNLARPKNFDNDPSHYQVKATQDIQPNRFDVSYGATQVIEATIRKELGDADITVSVVGQSGNVTIPMTPAPAGERYNEVKGYYFERRQATFPGIIGTRAVQAGDIVNVVVKAGGLQQEFRYRVAALPDVPAAGQPAKKRVLVVAAEDYTGVSPNVTPGYATAPRYLAQHVSALEAAGYEVETFNIDAPPPNGGSPNPVQRPQIKYADQPRRDVALRRRQLLHRRRLHPAGADGHQPAPLLVGDGADRVAGDGAVGAQACSSSCVSTPRSAASWSSTAATSTRRSRPRAPACRRRVPTPGPRTSCSASSTRRTTRATTTCPAPPGSARAAVSNDIWQNYLGVVGRQSGTGVALSTTPNSGNPNIAGFPVAAKAGGLFAGMAPFAIEQGSADEPNQNADGTPNPQARLPLRLRNWGPTNEPLRADTVQADFATPVTYTTGGGAIVSTRDAVSFSFGLEQVDQAARNELVRRAMSYLLPATADTTAPTIVGFKYPPNLSTGTPRDPVDIELTAYDERGDMDYVDLKVGNQLIQRTEVYPFQFRYTPPASAVGSVVTLTAEAVDSAGNKSTRTLLVNVLAGDTPPGTPVAVAPPTLLGTPTVGSQLSCLSGGFLNQPKTLAYAWLRNGAVIAGATTPSYTLTAADLGRSVACRITATNDAGSGDATSDSRDRVQPGPGVQPRRPSRRRSRPPRRTTTTTTPPPRRPPSPTRRPASWLRTRSRSPARSPPARPRSSPARSASRARPPVRSPRAARAARPSSP